MHCALSLSLTTKDFCRCELAWHVSNDFLSTVHQKGIPTYRIGVGGVLYAPDRSISLPSSPTFSKRSTKSHAVQSTLFWDDLLALDINRAFLKNQLVQLDKDSCLGELKVSVENVTRTEDLMMRHKSR